MSPAGGTQTLFLECCIANRLHQTSEKILKFEQAFIKMEGKWLENVICVLLKILIFKTRIIVSLNYFLSLTTIWNSSRFLIGRLILWFLWFSVSFWAWCFVCSGAEALLSFAKITSQKFLKVITTLAPKGNVFIFETELFLQLLAVYPKSAWTVVSTLILSLLSASSKLIAKSHYRSVGKVSWEHFEAATLNMPW